jgi:hypothetical protein
MCQTLSLVSWVGQLNNGFQVNVIRNGRGETTAQKNTQHRKIRSLKYQWNAWQLTLCEHLTLIVITMYAAEGKHAMY